MKRRVVVTGLGAVTPIGNTVEEFWNGVRKGACGIGTITKFDTAEYKVHLAGEVKGFVAKERMDFKAARRMGTFSQYPYPNALPRYCECARFVGVNGSTDEEVFENFLVKIEELKARVGIKKTIRDYGVTEEAFLATLDDMCEQAFDDQCTGANPRYPLISEIKAMYLKAFYGEVPAEAAEA